MIHESCGPRTLLRSIVREVIPPGQDRIGSGARPAGSSLLESGFVTHRFSLNLDFDLGSFCEPNFLPVRIRESVRNPDFPVKVIRAFDRDLGFLRFTGSRMRLNYLFNFSWEYRTCFGHFRRHDCCPPLGPAHILDKIRRCGSTALKTRFSEYFYLSDIG